MKAKYFILPVLFVVSMSSTSCSKDNTNSTAIPDMSVTQENDVTLIGDEKDDLIHMREEEKLARDIYLYNYDLYGLNIFRNIAKAEQTHMDRILGLLVTYNIPDPASPTIGVFNNPDLQTLYNDLIVQSKKSLLDALLVGATIEDLDIYDLDESLKNTSKADIILAYENLNCGSRNHMRAFSGQLSGRGSSYTPQFISLQKYQDILNDKHEKCGLQNY